MLLFCSSKSAQCFTIFLVFIGFSLSLSNSEILDGKNSLKNVQKRNIKFSPEEIVRMELEEFEREVEEFTRTKPTTTAEDERRKKRTVIFNVETPVNLGVILGIPFTVILPTLTNFFNWKWKRSAGDEVGNGIEDEENELFEEDPMVQPHLERISSYFELIKVPEKSCQRRAVCEFSAEPEKFYPISELVLNRIRNPSLPIIATLEDDFNTNNSTINAQPKSSSLFKLYTQAADQGMRYGTPICANEFLTTCPHSIEKRLNMPVLQFWNLLSNLLQFSMRDDVQF